MFPLPKLQTCGTFTTMHAGRSSSCEEAGHSGKYPGSIWCYNCGGAHPTSLKDCNKILRILQLLTQEFSFPEARKRVVRNLLRPGVNYASDLEKFITHRHPCHASKPIPSVGTPKRSSTPRPISSSSMSSSTSRKGGFGYFC